MRELFVQSLGFQSALHLLERPFTFIVFILETSHVKTKSRAQKQPQPQQHDSGEPAEAVTGTDVGEFRLAGVRRGSDAARAPGPRVRRQRGE